MYCAEFSRHSDRDSIFSSRFLCLFPNKKGKDEKRDGKEKECLRRGILSMGRYSDPDSAQSSFSVLLGDAPHLDGQYAIFGKLTKGDETLRKLEQLPTKKEGIFVMPTERITILSSYYYDTEMEICEQDRSLLKRRLAASAIEIERQRMKCFP
ncbi:peptidyl-prolyl cis-trans isomerase CYP23 [Coffea arabica]|uniref:Peptidyl-prolyl cis-trans isomerase CYP23 n=1 Tax=Coffea arabica TaxID=13443 RepID=A0A6P6V5F8_COFAR|nr:peptidyl-prolyl cis-trans isomerase CYP23 [Coffea arabica]